MTARSNHLRVLAVALPATVAVVCLLAFAGPVANATGPAGNENIRIPLRWCALNGTTAATNTNSVLLQRQMRASEQIWVPGANITFISPFPGGVPKEKANFPVISDPRPPVSSQANPNESGLGPGQVGDILYPHHPDRNASDAERAAQAAEWLAASAECDEEWDKFALPPPVGAGVSIKGPIAFTFRQFVDANENPVTNILGWGDPPTSFSATGPPGPLDPWCETPPDKVTAAEGGFMGVVDFSFVPGPQSTAQDAKVVAHELGHALLLGHGNGIDDDGDIKYDGFCDDGEPASVSPGSEYGLNSPPTIMHPNLNGTTTNVTTLQRGTIRRIARVTPGSQIDPPFELVNGDTLSDRRVDDAQDVKGAALDMTGVGMTINPEQERVILSHTLFGLVSKDESTEYAAFLDLDSDPTTGGRAAELGFPTRFKGAELVTRVRVQGGKFKRVHPGQVGEGRTATPTVWRFEGGEFAKITKSKVTATVSAPVAEPEVKGERPFPMFDVVSAQLPSDVVGDVGSRVRLQAITAGKGKDWVDVLPGERVSRKVPAGSADLFMTPPTFPACTTIPEVAQPGDVVTLKATGFHAPGEEVNVFLDAEHVANAELNRAGKMSTDVAIPKETRGEPHLITIRVGNSALTAECIAATADTRGTASPTAAASPTATALGESGGPPVPLPLTLAAVVLLVAFGVIARAAMYRRVS